MTSPLTPPDCDLTDFQRMMIDIPRLRGSNFDATLDDGAWRAGLNLWLTSWHQVPAASLPDDDVALTKAAGLGRDIKTWRKVKAEALRGWVKCDDGLLYHETVAEFALEAWLEKLAQTLSSGAGNAKRWKVEFNPDPIEAEIDRTANMLAALNPKSKALIKLERRRARAPGETHPDGNEKASRRDTPDVPSGSLGKGTGKGTIEEPPKPPEGASPDLTFEEAFTAYPASGRATNSPAKARAAWTLAVSELGAAPLLVAVRAYADHVRGEGANAKAPPAFHRWLTDRRWENFPSKAGGATSPWRGPPEVWAAVAGATSDDFAKSWLADCTWQDVPARTLSSPSTTAIKRLREHVGPLLHDMDIELELRAA